MPDLRQVKRAKAIFLSNIKNGKSVETAIVNTARRVRVDVEAVWEWHQDGGWLDTLDNEVLCPDDEADRQAVNMETIRLALNGDDFVEFTGRLMFRYRENDETRISLYKTADSEAGKYALYVEQPDGNEFYCFGESEDGGLNLAPKLTAK